MFLKVFVSVQKCPVQSLGIRWSPGQECGLDTVELGRKLAGDWLASVLDAADTVTACSNTVEIASPATVR